MTLTIFTPTYNRAFILPKLFESLSKQKYFNFRWLIVDDGSTDNTEELITAYKNKAAFDITYYKQENQGKHIAINKALDLIDTEYFLTIDSDDILADNVIETIISFLEKINNSIVCLAFPRKDISTQKLQISNNLPADTVESTPYKLYLDYNITGEFSLVFKTSIHKEYKYPQFEDEKYIKESVVYNRIFTNHSILYINKVIVEGDYLNDGLSNNYKKLLINNPHGSSLSHKEKMNNKSYRFSDRINEALSFWDYESIYNRSFFGKINQIQSNKLKLFVLYEKLKKNT